MKKSDNITTLTLRLPEGLKNQLERAAKSANPPRSLNSEVIYLLEYALSLRASPGDSFREDIYRAVDSEIGEILSGIKLELPHEKRLELVLYFYSRFLENPELTENGKHAQSSEVIRLARLAK